MAAPASSSPAATAQRVGNRRRWIGLLFCAAPLIALTAVLVFGIPVSQVLLWAFILVCPFSHLLLGRGSHRH